MNATEILSNVKNLLKQYKFSNVQLTDKSLIQFQGDELKKGLPVSLLINSKASPLPNGEYKTLDGISFTIEKGIVSKLEGKSTESKPGPVLQAQAADTPKDTIENPMKKIDPKDKTVVKQDKDGQSTVDTPDPSSATPDDTAEDDFDDTQDDTTDDSDAPLTVSTMMAALKPFLDSIKNIETSMCGEMSKQTAMSKELADTREALGTLTDVVDTLASKPDGKPIEAKKNPFKKSKDEDFTQSKTYKLFQEMNKSK